MSSSSRPTEGAEDGDHGASQGGQETVRHRLDRIEQLVQTVELFTEHGKIEEMLPTILYAFGELQVCRSQLDRIYPPANRAARAATSVAVEEKCKLCHQGAQAWAFRRQRITPECENEAVICASCFSAHIDSELTDSSWEDIACPVEGCFHSLPPELVTTHASREQLARLIFTTLPFSG